MEAFLGALSSEQSRAQGLRRRGERRARRLFDETVNGRSADRALFLRELFSPGERRAPAERARPGPRDDAAAWFDAITVTVDRIREVEHRYAQAIAARSRQLNDDEHRRALLVAIAVATLLLVVLLSPRGWPARWSVRCGGCGPRLWRSPENRLPAVVQRLRESESGRVLDEVPAIQVFSRDEMGEVARAFDEVHREAVRLAGNEARLRASVNAMFVNLSRRSQTLVERQLSLVERWSWARATRRGWPTCSSSTTWPPGCAATARTCWCWPARGGAAVERAAADLMDVARAALSEVEGYDRVTNRVRSEVAVAGEAVSDVVHLLAELVENALGFSPRDAKVTLSGSRSDYGGVMLSVTDGGIGMSPEDLDEANRRLMDPPLVDVSVSRRMGLFVVGRLALRHDIKVRLRRHDLGGLTAMVLLPEALVVPGLRRRGRAPAGGPRLAGAGDAGSAAARLRDPAAVAGHAGHALAGPRDDVVAVAGHGGGSRVAAVDGPAGTPVAGGRHAGAAVA